MSTVSLTERIETQSLAHPKRLALVTPDGQKVSFQQLQSAISAFATHLTDAGVRERHLVVPLTDNLSVRLCLWLATMRIGAVASVPTNVEAIQNAGLDVDWIVALPDQVGSSAKVLHFDQSWFSADRAVPYAPPAGLLAASSGTTGWPKFMRYGDSANEARNAHMNVSAGTPDGNVLAGLSLKSAGGLRFVMRAWSEGFAAVLPISSPSKTLELCAENDVRSFSLSPQKLADLTDAAEAGTPVPQGMTHIETVGGSVSRNLLERAEKVFACPVTDIFGMAEIGTVASGQPLHQNYEPGLIGPVAEWAELRVLDESGNKCPTDVTGRLSVRVPEALRVTYIGIEGPYDKDGWFVTGDWGRLREDGQLVLAGRLSEVINTGGDTLAPGLIENAVTEVPGVNRAAAFAVPGTYGFDEIGIVIVRSDGFVEADLRKNLSRRFGSYYQYHLYYADALPMTPIGKVDRAALRKTYAGGQPT